MSRGACVECGCAAGECECEPDDEIVSILLRVPRSLRDAINASARGARMSANAWLTWTINDELARERAAEGRNDGDDT